MKNQARSAHFTRWNWKIGALAAAVLVLSSLSLVSPTLAQEGGNQAGLVVQFGDGSLYTACVDLGHQSQATGEEVLRASGLSALIDYGSGFGGGTVCKIGNEGCSFPAEKCFCQCTMKPGDPCIYWSYFHQVDGQWRYSNQGVSSYIVQPGDIEAWVWGPGSAGAGVEPPAITLDQICGVESPAILSSPTVEPSIPTATQTPPPTIMPTVLRPTATNPPTSTPRPSFTPVPTEMPPPTDTPVPETSTVSPQPSATATQARIASPTPSATRTLQAAMAAPNTPTAPKIASRAEVKTVTPGGGAEEAETSASQSVESVSENNIGYIVFGLLVVGLLGTLLFLRVR